MYFDAKGGSKNLDIITSGLPTFSDTAAANILAFLNNFLDTDKAAVIFWTLTAMIVFFNIETKKSTK